MECEVCGKKTNKIFVAEIEGAILEVCEECAKKGKIVNIKSINKTLKEKKEIKPENEEEFEIIENYNEIIREAREKLNISVQELAKKIGEKESLLRKIERGEIIPNDKLVEKFEKFLKVKLKEKIENRTLSKNERKEGLRIADVVEIK